MASASSATDLKETDCPVCHEDFTQPKILPCAHVFCRDCIVKWLQSELKPQCPLCRCAIVDTGSTKNCEDDIVDALPTDLAMKSLVQSAQTLRKDHVCCGHPEALATSLCLSCSDMLCRSCATAHGRLTATQHHTVEDLASLTAERLAASRPATCLTHRGELCKLFCTSHGETICHLCATTKHRACPEVTELEEKIQEARRVLAELSATLKMKELGLERTISQLDQELVQTEEKTQKSLTEIDSTCDQLIMSVNLRRQCLRELQTLSNDNAKQTIAEMRTDLLGQCGKLTSHSLLVDRIDKTVSPADVQGMKTTLQNLVSKLSLTIPVPLSRLRSAIIKTVEIDQKVVSSIEKELERLGKLTDTRNDVCEKPMPVPQSAPSVDSSAFCFHSNHGKNILLSDNDQTAEWVLKENCLRGANHGIVIAANLMKIKTLYEVTVKITKGVSGMRAGVAVDHPRNLIPLPANAWNWKSAVVINFNSVSDRTTLRQIHIGQQLDQLRAGERVGVLLDAASCLHLYIDGKDKGIAARDVQHPCYVIFQLMAQGVSKITALPPTSIP